MTKKTKLFNLERISPQKVYDTIIEILEETLVPNTMKPRRLTLKTHSILFSSPFIAEIEAIHGISGFSWGEKIYCRIYASEGETILKITSKGERTALADGPQHRKNIFGLYSELNFRLQTEGKPPLNQYLLSNEKKIARIYPIIYQGIKLDSIITNLRILLCRNETVFGEINHKNITSTTFRKEREYISAGYFFLAIIFLMIGLPIFFIVGFSGGFSDPEVLSFILWFTLPLISIGTFFLTIGIMKNYVRYLQIQTIDGFFKVHADKILLNELNKIIRHITIEKLPPSELIPEKIPMEDRFQKRRDKEGEKFRKYRANAKYYEDLEKLKVLFEEAKHLHAQGSLKKASKKFRKVVKSSVELLDSEMAIAAVNQSIPINEIIRSQLLEKFTRKSPEMNIRREALLKSFVYDWINSTTQKAEKNLQKGKIKSAATLFLQISINYLETGENEKAKEFLEKFKLCRSHL